MQKHCTLYSVIVATGDKQCSLTAKIGNLCGLQGQKMPLKHNAVRKRYYSVSIIIGLLLQLWRRIYKILSVLRLSDVWNIFIYYGLMFYFYAVLMRFSRSFNIPSKAFAHHLMDIRYEYKGVIISRMDNADKRAYLLWPDYA